MRSEWKVKKKKLLEKQVKNRDKWVFGAKLVMWRKEEIKYIKNTVSPVSTQLKYM